MTFEMEYVLKSMGWFDLNGFINMAQHITQIMNFFMYLSLWRETRLIYRKFP